MIFLSPELWGNYNCSWKLQLWLEKTKALLEKTSLSITIGPTTVKLVNIELKKTLSNAEKPISGQPYLVPCTFIQTVRLFDTLEYVVE